MPRVHPLGHPSVQRMHSDRQQHQQHQRCHSQQPATKLGSEPTKRTAAWVHPEDNDVGCQCGASACVVGARRQARQAAQEIRRKVQSNQGQRVGARQVQPPPACPPPLALCCCGAMLLLASRTRVSGSVDAWTHAARASTTLRVVFAGRLAGR